MAEDAEEEEEDQLRGGNTGNANTPDMTYGAIISPQYAFGTTGLGRAAMCYVEGDKVMYPVGAHMAVYSSSADEMKLLPLAEKVKASYAVTLSNNRKYFAVIEDVEDCTSQVVSVYSMATAKRVKCLQLGSATGNESVKVSDISFSENSKFLITQCGEPDHQMLVWRWYTNKVVCTLKHDKPILAACFNPADDTQLALAHSSGAFLVRLDGESGNSRPVPLPTAEQTRNTITSFTWLVGNVLAFTSSRGRIQINQDTDIKAVYKPDVEDHLTCIVTKGRGFVAGGHKGLLYFYDPPEPSAKRAGNTDLFVLVHVISCNLPGRAIASLAMSGSEDYACVLCGSGEMLSLSMETMREHEEKELQQLLGNTRSEQDTDPFSLITGGVGNPNIVSMDAIEYVPLMAVATGDKFVRVVNYESRSCVVAKNMIDDIMCCALHPSGAMIAVGLHEKLQLFSIAQDELGDLASFSVKKCHLARFSSGGGMLAAVGRSNTIYVYHAFNFTQLVVLKGHVSVVTSFCFSPDERNFVSVGAGGSVYFWDLNTSRRLADSEYVDKRALYASAAFGGHNGRISAVVRAADGRIQHVMQGKVEYEVAGPKCADRSSLSLLGEDRVVLITDDKGSILSYPWPGSFPAPPGMARFAEPQTYRLHAPRAGAISTMVVLPKCGLVLTSSLDGIVIMSRLDMVLRGQLMEPQPAPWSLSQGGAGPMALTLPVPLERLHIFKAKMVELATLLGTTKSDAEYQSFRQSQALRESLARTEAELADVRRQLADKQAELDLAHASVSDREQAIVKELEAAHMAAADELEALFDRRLELEVQKLEHMTAERDDKQFKVEEQMKRMASRHEAEVARLRAMYNDARNRTREIEEEFAQKQALEQAQFEEYMYQAEDDFDEASDRANERIEIINQGAQTKEAQLRAEVNILKRTNLRFKGDKALELKKMSKVLADNSAMREAVADGQITISKLERELQGREEVISDNFVTIQGLRRRIQELEKHKFVLTYKADAFSKELDPARAAAEEMGRDLMQHEAELLKERTENARLMRTLKEREAASRILKRDLDNANMRCTQQESLLGLFSVDVQAVMAASDAKGSAGTKSARERAIEELYRKYCREWHARVKTSDQVEAELTRHLHMAEIHKELLQRRLTEGSKQGKGSKHAGLHQNMALLRELQVATHDGKVLAQSLEKEHNQLRELSVRYRLLEARLKGNEQASSQALPQQGPDEAAAGLASYLATSAAPLSSITPSFRPERVSGSLSGTEGLQGASAKKRPMSAHPGGRQQRQADGIVRGSPARNLAEMLAQEQAAIMSQMHAVMERMVGAQSHARLEAISKQQSMLEHLQKSLKQQVEAEQAEAAGEEPQQGRASFQANSSEALSNQQQQQQQQQQQKQHLGQGGAEASSRSPYLPHNAVNHRPTGFGPRARPTSAGPSSNYTALLNSSGGPTAFASPARRRPQSAAGVGMRAFVNGNTQAWRKKQ